MSDSEEPNPSQSMANRVGCPYLGLQNDPQTRFGFPSLGNYCHRINPPALVTVDYQQNFCFTKEFPNCVVYQGASKNQLPDGIIPKPQSIQTNKNLLIVIALVIAAAILTILLVAITNRNRNAIIKNQFQTATVIAINLALTPPPSNTPLPPTLTPTLVPSLTPTASRTPTITSTYTAAPPTQGPGLETPFGPKNEFIIHKVGIGESFSNLAYEFQTSINVITTTNEIRGEFIQLNEILVIIPNVTENLLGLPVFHPIYLDKDASVQALSQEYGVTPINLRHFNALGESDLIPAGRWIIIPLPSKSGP